MDGWGASLILKKETLLWGVGGVRAGCDLLLDCSGVYVLFSADLSDCSGVSMWPDCC